MTQYALIGEAIPHMAGYHRIINVIGAPVGGAYQVGVNAFALLAGFWIGDVYSPSTGDFAKYQPSLDELLAQKLASIMEERERRLLQDGFLDAGFTGKRFQTDPVSIGKINAVGTLGFAAQVAQQTQTFYFIATDNTVQSFTEVEVFDWAKRVAVWVQTVMLLANAKKQAARAAHAAGDRATLEAIDPAVGWPD